MSEGLSENRPPHIFCPLGDCALENFVMSVSQTSSSNRVSILLRIMTLIGLCAMTYVVLQSCTLPQDNLQRFTKGSLSKLKILKPTVPQPSRVFYDSESKPVTLQNFHGRYVVLNVWATWCVPCIAEIPSLDILQGEYADKNLSVITVSMDRKSEDGQKFYETAGVQHLKFYHDPALAMAGDVGVQGLPISIFYDTNGSEIARVPGEVNWQSDEVKVFLTYMFTVR